jgi:hypothetical protein
MIIIGDYKHLYKRAYNVVQGPVEDDGARIIREITANLNSLYYSAFEPEAKAAIQRYPNKSNAFYKKMFLSSNFSNMMFEEVLNDLSNITGDAMLDLSDSDEASIAMHFSSSVLPYFINKLMGND